MTRNQILRHMPNASEDTIKANLTEKVTEVGVQAKSKLKANIETKCNEWAEKPYDVKDLVNKTESPFLINQLQGAVATLIKRTVEPFVKDCQLPIIFTIPGQPVPKPRMTQQDRWMKRPRVQAYWEWAAKARASVPKGANLTDVGHLEMKVFLTIPKSYSKKKRKSLMGQAHRGRGDGDNFLKSLQDSLLKQDCGIWKFSGEKRWEDERGPRMEVCLY